jgi:alkylation response protein AidB-like acyl-CoA dehydrogenase
LVLGARPGIESYAVLAGSGTVERVVEVPKNALTSAHRLGLDGRFGTVHVTGRLDGAADLVGEPDAGRAWWAETEATLRLALSSYIAGGLRSMFELARDHAAEREQFGRRVGTFQAVRHKLAESYVAVEALDAACGAAWDTSDRVLTAATTKLVASRSVSTVAAHTQQVLAGIGFTAEHPFHGFLKPVLMCDRLLGGASELAIEVGACMVHRAAAPRLVEL